MNSTAIPRNAVLAGTFVILAALFLIACRQQPQPLPPDATATAAGDAPQTASPPDQWATIRERGRLIVGTSADYPPFAFYTDEFELDGYDVALAQLIGEQLGVEVELRDMAFDGLGGALQVGQIDAAIAAISVTDERRASVDFSSVYLVSEGAALARAGSGVTISGPEDLAGHRVAVQSGSVYEAWLQETLVDTGIMPADNMLVYVDTDKAIEDLAAGLVDVALADALPLEVASRDNAAFTVAGRGLNRQRFAVAVPKGSSILSPINEAMFELQNDGRLAELAERYLNLEPAELLPLPLPEPTAGAGDGSAPSRAPAGCIDAMTLVSHLSLDDGNMQSPPPVSPGTPFQKGWRVLNNGTCTWTEGYLLTPVDANVPQAGMGGSATPILGRVEPGQTYDLYVSLVAPLVPGVYQSFWSMRNPNGLLFGDRIWAGITVPAQPTPTPPPTATVSPRISFTVDRTHISAGECVIFAWDVTDAEAVYFYTRGQAFEQNRVAASGQQTECPPSTIFYELRAVFADGTNDIRSIRIDVQPAPQSPAIESFTVNPGNVIVEGQCVDVRWRVSSDATNIRVTRNDTTLWNGAPLSGTSRDCPPAGEVSYGIEATGPGGTSRGLQNVTVQAATAVPGPLTPTPSNQLPVINSFSVQPTTITVGTCLAIAWDVSGNAGRVQLRRNDVLVLDFAVHSGSVTDCPGNPGTYIYRIDAFNSQGGSTFQQVMATVVQ